MLACNRAAAEKILDSYPQTAVLRRHLPPPKSNFDLLADVMKKRMGLDLDVSSSKALAASLDRAVVSHQRQSMSEGRLADKSVSLLLGSRSP